VEAEKELSKIRKMSCRELFWERWRGPMKKLEKVYAGSELYKEHMIKKEVISG